MNKLIQNIMAAWLLLVSLILSNVQAETIPGDKEDTLFTPQEGTIEARSITLLTNQNSTITGVITNSCASCSPRNIPVTESIQFFILDSSISSQQAYELNGRPGTIKYDLGSKLVTSIHYSATKGE